MIRPSDFFTLARLKLVTKMALDFSASLVNPAKEKSDKISSDGVEIEAEKQLFQMLYVAEIKSLID